MGQLGDLSPAASVTIGVIVGLLSTSIQSLGLTLQRKSHLLEDEKENDFARRPPYRRRRWQIGMFMFVVANIVGSTIQITTLPLPVLSTLQASGLVFNTLCAALLLGEPLTRWSVGGTLLVSSGAVLIAFYGALPEPSHNLVQLLDLLVRRHFILWMSFTALVIIGIGTCAWILTRVKTQNRPRIRLWRGMCFGSISAILSAHCLLIAKSAVELVVRTIVDGKNQFDRWQSWIILLALIVFALSQLYFLHRGLKLCSTSVLYPFVFCIYNVIAIIDGLIYFRQADRLPPLHGGIIGVGTFILLAGVLALSWRLDEEEEGPPADAHSLLTPGMGLVDEDSMRDGDATSDSDIESSMHAEQDAGISTERTPLLSRSRGTSMSPSIPQDRGSIKLGKRRHAGKVGMDEIWDELHDSPIKPKPDLPFGRGPRRAVTLAVGEDVRALKDPAAISYPSLSGDQFEQRSGRHQSWSSRARDRFNRRRRSMRPRSTSTPLPNLSLAVPERSGSSAISPLWWLGLGWWNQRTPVDSQEEIPDQDADDDSHAGEDETL